MFLFPEHALRHKVNVRKVREDFFECCLILSVEYTFQEVVVDSQANHFKCMCVSRLADQMGLD